MFISSFLHLLFNGVNTPAFQCYRARCENVWAQGRAGCRCNSGSGGESLLWSRWPAGAWEKEGPANRMLQQQQQRRQLPKITLCRFLSHTLVYTFPTPVNLISWLLLFASPNLFLPSSCGITSPSAACPLLSIAMFSSYSGLQLILFVSISLIAQPSKQTSYWFYLPLLPFLSRRVDRLLEVGQCKWHSWSHPPEDNIPLL